MNFLAHILLSGDDKKIQIGNFIGDAIKGKDYLHYPVQIKKGILLHRQIDAFTDANAIVHRSKKRLDKRYGHYAGVIIDIIYDHFLCVNWGSYSKEPLDSYIAIFYKTIQLDFDLIPKETQRFIPSLLKQDWFTKYQSIEGIAKVLQGMEKQIKHNIPLHRGVEDLKEKYDLFNADFNEFFPLLQEHSKSIIQILDNEYK